MVNILPYCLNYFNGTVNFVLEINKHFVVNHYLCDTKEMLQHLLKYEKGVLTAPRPDVRGHL